MATTKDRLARDRMQAVVGWIKIVVSVAVLAVIRIKFGV